MPVKNIGIVSFNGNEARAVELLLNDIAGGPPSPWQRDGPRAIRRDAGLGDSWRLEHVPLLAQGNVIAAARLAEFFQDHSQAPDYVVFYGCAGALDPTDHASAFIVRNVNYVSLGSVDEVPGGEQVTLKNKWLCHLSPSGDALPLDALAFPLAASSGTFVDLVAKTGLTAARVIATDKVIRIRPGTPPAPIQTGPPHDLFSKEEWTYGEAMALFASGPHVIVEMESYGIALIARALKIEERVIVVRVTTDVLVDHAVGDDSQRSLLERGRHVLGRVLAVLFDPLDSP